jgi:hypothetical protein
MSDIKALPCEHCLEIASRYGDFFVKENCVGPNQYHKVRHEFEWLCSECKQKVRYVPDEGVKVMEENWVSHEDDIAIV